MKYIEEVNSEWILVSYEKIKLIDDIEKYLPEDPNVGAVYFDYRKNGSIKFHRYMHLLMPQEEKINHIIVRKKFISDIDESIFKTLITIYNKSIIKHIPIIAFEIQ